MAKAKEEYEEKTELVRIAKSEQKLAETNFNKVLAMTYEDYVAEQQQLTIPGFE